MVNEIDEIVDDVIEDLGVDAVIEHEREQGIKPRWEGWVALSASVLAVLSAVSALYATFAADEAAIAEADETTYSAYREGAQASYHVLRAKVEILEALGQPPTAEAQEELELYRLQAEEYREKAAEYDQEGRDEFVAHDRLAIAVTLFQVAILLGGLAVVVQRPALWIFGLSFGFSGLALMAWGLINF